MKNKVYIVGHSLSPQGAETITVLATFPRIILSEINTHRMLSKNTSSSRAIPFLKMVEAVQNNPFIPIAWQKEHKGMQGSEYIIDKYEIGACIEEWLEARDSAVKHAVNLNKDSNGINPITPVTKQLCNRLLEPFMWTTMLITGSKEGWDNFFNLRCPSYKLIGLDKENVKSRKEWLEKMQFSSALHQSMYPKTDVEWLQINKGQAEIHMMALAESIYDAMNESTPKQLKAGEWHIPFEDKMNEHEIAQLQKSNHPPYYEQKVKISTAMSAHTSYTVVGNEPVKSVEKWIELHDKLIAYDPPHSSPMEHCARAMNDEEYVSYIKGVPDMIDYEKDEIAISYLKTYEDSPEAGWCNNLKGFIPYRYFIDNGIEL